MIIEKILRKRQKNANLETDMQLFAPVSAKCCCSVMGLGEGYSATVVAG